MPSKTLCPSSYHKTVVNHKRKLRCASFSITVFIFNTYDTETNVNCPMIVIGMGQGGGGWALGKREGLI